MRYPLVIGNWKLNGSKQIVNSTISYLNSTLNNIICKVAIAPPSVYLDLAKYFLDKYNSTIFLGAQNVDINISGPFTGEVSVKMLKEIGVKYIIIGHSERRNYHKENDNIIAKKFSIIKDNNIIPVLCIGENKIEKEKGHTKIVCANQINAVLKIVSIKSFENAVIAYEPTWAIGTGKSAVPIQIQEVHKFIRNYIAQYDTKIAQYITILYGGSVNAENAYEIFIQPDIDGALVGNASLHADSFAKIVKSATKAKNKI